MIPIFKVAFLKMLFPLLGLFWVLALIVLYLWAREHHRARIGSTSPVSRPPGHAVDIALTRRYLDLVLWALTIGFVPSYTTLSYMRGQTAMTSAVFTAIGALVTLLAIAKGCGCMRTIRRLHLERQGKVLVGRLLEEVLPVEFRVFHDVFMEKGEDATIDHVVIGPTGVYAVATRIRARETGLSGNARPVAVERSRVLFPVEGKAGETVSLAQIRDQARRLKAWLTITTREPYAVQPVLVLPGWEVPVSSNAEVRVLNESTLVSLGKGKRLLQPTAIHDIAGRLERCCRAEYGRPREALPGPADLIGDEQQ